MLRDKIFLVVLFGFLGITLLLTHLFPSKELVLRENRRRQDFPVLSAESVRRGEFQERWESALADRIFLADAYKQGYNRRKQLELEISAGLFSLLSRKRTQEFGQFQADYLPRGENIFEIKESGNLFLFVYEPEKLVPIFQEKLRQMLTVLKKAKRNFPQADFFLYYIESNRDIDFKNRCFPHTYQRLLQETWEEIGKTNVFSVDDLTDFTNHFYRTDHHWNEKGQAKAYRAVMDLLFAGKEQAHILTPVKIEGISFVGSRARQIGDFSTGDDFWINTAELPEFDTYVNGQKAVHGEIQNYLDGKIEKNIEISHYGRCFGEDVGLLTYDFHAPQKENLLVIADSYSNPINLLLAAHFNRSYFVDLRHYAKDMQKSFDLEDLIKQHKIDKVLILGSAGMIISDSFVLE